MKTSHLMPGLIALARRAERERQAQTHNPFAFDDTAWDQRYRDLAEQRDTVTDERFER